MGRKRTAATLEAWIWGSVLGLGIGLSAAGDAGAQVAPSSATPHRTGATAGRYYGSPSALPLTAPRPSRGYLTPVPVLAARPIAGLPATAAPRLYQAVPGTFSYYTPVHARPGRVASRPYRDWPAARNLPLAKPWLMPLQP